MEIECISEYGERVYACTTWYEGSGKEVGPSVEGALIDELMNGKVCFYGTLIDGIQTLREEHHADVTAEMMEIVTKNLAA